jgi:hypothetical protein
MGEQEDQREACNIKEIHMPAESIAVPNRAARRRFFGSVGKVSAALGIATIAGCSALGIGSTTTAAGITQVLLDVQGGIATLKLVVTGAAQYLGKAATAAINNALTAASDAFASLTSTAASAGNATTIQTIEGYLQSAVTAIVAALAGATGASTWLTLAQTVAALLPAIVAWINSIIPTTTANANVAVPRDYHPIRRTLGIPTLA